MGTSWGQTTALWLSSQAVVFVGTCCGKDPDGLDLSLKPLLSLRPFNPTVAASDLGLNLQVDTSVKDAEDVQISDDTVAFQKLGHRYHVSLCIAAKSSRLVLFKPGAPCQLRLSRHSTSASPCTNLWAMLLKHMHLCCLQQVKFGDLPELHWTDAPLWATVCHHVLQHLLMDLQNAQYGHRAFPLYLHTLDWSNTDEALLEIVARNRNAAIRHCVRTVEHLLYLRHCSPKTLRDTAHHWHIQVRLFLCRAGWCCQQNQFVILLSVT